MGKPLEIIVDRGNQGDPVSGQSSVNIPWLAGQDIWIEKAGIGPVDYSSYSVNANGGFSFTNINDKFAPGEVFFVHTTGLSLPTSGNYSNGFKYNSVLNALLGRVGWKQPTRSDAPVLSGINLTSNGGRFFNEGFHSIVTPNIIKSVQEDPGINDTNFNALLVGMQKAAIMKSLNGVFNRKEELERKLLFERYGRQDYPNLNTGAFVGIRIVPPRDFAISAQIDSISLYFDRDVTFNLYLFHDAKKNAIWQQSVSATGGQQTVINFDQFVINYFENNKSGVFYLGYFQDDLGAAQGINEIVQQFNSFCCFDMYPVELPRIQAQYQINVNYIALTVKTHGLNLQMSAFRDHTESIIRNAYLFDEVIGLQMAAAVIEMIQSSTRSNKDERITTEMTKQLYNDLNLAKTTDDFPYSTGIKNEISRELQRIRNTFFPRQKPRTVTNDTDNSDIYGIPQVDYNWY